VVRLVSREDVIDELVYTAVIDYAAARAAWQTGAAFRFPSGTYWLRRFANVPIAST
jgi:hypothetical protein